MVRTEDDDGWHFNYRLKILQRMASALPSLTTTTSPCKGDGGHLGKTAVTSIGILGAMPGKQEVCVYNGR